MCSISDSKNYSSNEGNGWRHFPPERGTWVRFGKLLQMEIDENNRLYIAYHYGRPISRLHSLDLGSNDMYGTYNLLPPIPLPSAVSGRFSLRGIALDNRGSLYVLNNQVHQTASKFDEFGNLLDEQPIATFFRDWDE
jgi:hypothetical protein